MSTAAGSSERSCSNCGHPLAAGAAFCRRCGTKYEPPAEAFPPPPPVPVAVPPAPPPPPSRRRSSGRVAAVLAAAVLLFGIGAAAAVVLLGGKDGDEPASAGQPSRTAASVPVGTAPVPTRTGEASSGEGAAALPPTAVGSIEAGRYVQAGSFRTFAGARSEQQRLAAVGIRVQVISSDSARELYPGFQVLVGGPFSGHGSEAALLKRLRANGVPSAFARDLNPALELSGAGELSGRWTGTLERTGSSRTGLNGPLAVTLTASGGGQSASLAFTGIGCEVELSLAEQTTATLTYEQHPGCVGAGRWSLRPSAARLTLTLLPPNSDVIVLGTLHRP